MKPNRSARISKPFKIAIILFLFFIASMALISLVGYGVDRASQQRLDLIKAETLQKLENSLYYGPDNAWLYYEEAIDMAINVYPDAYRESYVYGRVPMSPELLQSISENSEVLDILKAGSSQPYCSVLFDFRSAIFRHNTNLKRLKVVTQVLCARALYEIENGNNQKGLQDVFAALLVAKHLAEISPTVLDQLNGVNILFWGLSILNTGVSSGTFSKSELETISVFLASLERDWPPVHATLDKHVSNLKIFVANSSISQTIQLTLIPNRGKKPSIFLVLLLRLRYWRNIFSPRRAFIRHFIFLDSVIDEMREIEERIANQGRWNNEQSLHVSFQNKIAKHHAANHIPEIFTPKFTNAGLLVNLTRVRLLNCASQLQRYRLYEGHYPADLSGFDSRIATDPNTGKAWEYKVTGDAAMLRSPGFNLKEKRDDIIMLLTMKGIESHLEQKRKIEDEK